jgi:hypothetical protein
MFPRRRSKFTDFEGGISSRILVATLRVAALIAVLLVGAAIYFLLA